MKTLFFTIALSILSFTTLFSQTNLDRRKAETAVENYMKAKSKNYTSIEFGEFFTQYFSEKLQKLAKTNDSIVYSIVHTYSIKNKKVSDSYFHLNKDYKVISFNTQDEMNKLVADDLMNNPIFDSIMKSVELDRKNK